VARGDVSDQSPVIGSDDGADDAQPSPLLYERRGGGEHAIFPVADEVRIERDPLWKASSPWRDLSLASGQHGGTNVREPQHRASVNDAEWIQDAGLDRHFTNDPLRRLLRDRELDGAFDFHVRTPAAMTSERRGDDTMVSVKAAP
jgi:hypothetical protein